MELPKNHLICLYLCGVDFQKDKWHDQLDTADKPLVKQLYTHYICRNIHARNAPERC